MNTSNPLAEIGALVIAGFLIIGGIILLYTGKVNFVEATLMFGSGFTLIGGNLALKAPSPAQQSQLMDLVTRAAVVQPPAVINNYVPAPAQPIPMQPGNTYPYPAVGEQVGAGGRAGVGAMQPPIENISTQTSIPTVRTNTLSQGS